MTDTMAPFTLAAYVASLPTVASDTVSWCRARTLGGQTVKCDCGRVRGSQTRSQMRAYALSVAVALTGSESCVHCLAPVSLTNGDVDRASKGCYAPGNVVMVCKECNGAKESMLVFNDTEYARDIWEASKGIPVPSMTHAHNAYLNATRASSIDASPYVIRAR